MARSDFVQDASGFETPDIHSSSVRYADRFAGSAGRWLLDVQELASAALLGDLPCDAVLDVGGGHGQNLPLLIDRFREVTVVGSDACCCQLLKPFLQEGKATFKQAPLLQTGFAPRSFDVVLSYRMLTHLQDWQGLVAELCRLARYSVLVEFPVRAGFNRLSDLLFSIKKGVEGNTRPFTLFDVQEVRREFERHGFFLRQRRAQFFWPMALHRLHGSRFCGRMMEGLPAALGLSRRYGSPVIARFDREEG